MQIQTIIGSDHAPEAARRPGRVGCAGHGIGPAGNNQGLAAYSHSNNQTAKVGLQAGVLALKQT